MKTGIPTTSIAAASLIAAALVTAAAGSAFGQSVTFTSHVKGKIRSYLLANDQVELTIQADSVRIISDKLAARPEWSKHYSPASASIETDGGFSFEVMWTDWQAPGKVNNAENPVAIAKSDFAIDKTETADLDGGGKILTLYLHGKDFPVLGRVEYALDPKSFYVRKRVAISDTSEAGHFLQSVAPFNASLDAAPAAVKTGGFGQPVAFRTGKGGVFFGIEYPAADNSLVMGERVKRILCSQEIGNRITSQWIGSDWAVEGISPDEQVKLWFMKYVNDIRVAPLRPYTLYNSWYDLRSAEYPKVPEENVMNEENIFRIIDLIKKNMIEKHAIQLDAFVLDDGWDTYESDWVLRDKQFPRGLKPISDELKKTNTGLGMWFGPTGGYSFRMRRIDWMKDHGYEVVGHTRNTAMLCLAGTKYGELFRKRTTDFVANEGVSFFKWDGIQFSCSEPGHGHPVGISSRRAVMESVIDKVKSVREKNPNVYLNITSGTWLSPWWVKYANQIWMQGSDYGYADVPSISPRDAAITYRDFILYDDFKNQNMWFPIANLMTHGIIKGNLEMLGGKAEPLDKFTNEALLYFARGVSMWELYISPDILTDGEWDAMAEAMHWARDRFPILASTEMVGGDPTKGETYGYVHFKGSQGILAVRNPVIEAKPIRIELAPSLGLDRGSSSLVLEKTYPTRWISPKLYKAGEKIELPLDGYETAVFEVYPLSEARGPLLAGLPFDAERDADGNEAVTVYATSPAGKLLNADKVKSISTNGAATSFNSVMNKKIVQPPAVAPKSVKWKADKSSIHAEFVLDASVQSGTISVLLTPSKKSAAQKPPQVEVVLDGAVDTAKFERGESASTWYSFNVRGGKHVSDIRIKPRDAASGWSGIASIWLVARQQQEGIRMVLSPKNTFAQRPMPPKPFPAGVMVRNAKIGEAKLDIR